MKRQTVIETATIGAAMIGGTVCIYCTVLQLHSVDFGVEFSYKGLRYLSSLPRWLYALKQVGASRLTSLHGER